MATDFINDIGTHSAGVLAAYGKRTMAGSPEWDRLRKAVNDWLEEAEIVLDLDCARAMLAALSLVLTRSAVYCEPVTQQQVQLLLAEVGATLVDIYENPRADLSDLDFAPEKGK